METLELALLCAAAVATSALSAIVGMAGGVTLLSVMLLFLDPLVAVPVHGVVQLVSNASRAAILRQHVDRGILWRYSLLLLPMGFPGLALARALAPAVARALIGLFVLIATWARGWLLLGTHPEHSDPRRRFVVLGGVVGFLNPTVGATGPLLAPFFLDAGLTRHGIVATKAACQMAGHLAKIAIFGLAGFSFGAHAEALALLCVSVVVGTWLGSRVLDRVSEVWFRRLYQGVLTVIALRLLIWDGLAALGVR